MIRFDQGSTFDLVFIIRGVLGWLWSGPKEGLGLGKFMDWIGLIITRVRFGLMYHKDLFCNYSKVGG